MQDIYKRRRDELASWMAKQGIAAVLFRDSELFRDPAIRYFTGHPSDAIYMQAVDTSCVLCPWDEAMAKQTACADSIIAFGTFDRNIFKAAKGLLKRLRIPKNTKVEIPSVTSYPNFLRFVHELPDYNIICREDGAAEFMQQMRAVKDEYEIDCIKTASAVTDSLIDSIEKQVQEGIIKTESDVALLIEKECRIAGCEGTGFETLAAGPSRSFGIHCFPPYTVAEWPAPGLSILDFGVVYKGYTSDVTITVAQGNLDAEQELQLKTVQDAYDAALPLFKSGLSVQAAAAKVDAIFAKQNRTMPHSLGHGYGLEAHEWPIIRANIDKSIVFKPGMVVTLEPGLYDVNIGGCRLENDILICENGSEVLTHARIIRIP
ncbi:MAG: Xaa-Pro peptidase family protein [Spirochaetales bacterium]